MFEKEIKKAISHFGAYLGTLEPKVPWDLCVWSAVLVMTDVTLISHTMSFMVGGVEIVITLRVRRWASGLVY
jgi:hypothetical protein